MAYKASPSAGTIIAVNINGNFTTIPGVDGCQPFGSVKAMIDTTPLDATAKTFTGDVPDPGSMKFAVMLDVSDATHGYLNTAAATPGQTDQWKVTPSKQTGTPKTYAFNGELMSFQPSFVKGQAHKADCEVKITGPITLA